MHMLEELLYTNMGVCLTADKSLNMKGNVHKMFIKIIL